MQDEEKLNLVLERFYNRFNKYNTEVLKTLGNVVKQFDGLTTNQAYILAQELKLGYDINKLQLELSKLSGKSVKDIDKLFDKVAEENVEFSEIYYKAKNKEYVGYEDNTQLQNLVESIKKQTNNTFINLANSNATGFSIEDSNGNKVFRTLPQVYNDLIDESVFNVSTGVQDYQSAMRNTLNQLADSGVKIHEEKVAYDSGYNRRIDSTIKQEILTGLKQINIGIQEEVGKQFGANGVEISAHSPCAEDHLDIQGRQYSDEEFEKLNGELDRPIGTYNCRHFVFSIVMGVNEPNYSKKQLDDMRKESLEKVTYKGKEYTKYEATQVQRKFETAIRKQKDRQITSKASGDMIGVGKAQQKITQLTKEYNDFSKSVGLSTYKNKLSVSGYKRTSISKMITKVTDYKIASNKEISNLDNATKKIMKEISKNSIEAISSYVGVGHNEINQTIINGKPDKFTIYNNVKEIQKDIKNIEKMMNKSILNQKITTFRGTYDDFNKYKIGDEFTLESFVSTSVSEKIAVQYAKRSGNGGVVLEILTPAKTKAIYTGDNFSALDEKELLLNKNLKYKIIDIKNIADKNYGNYKKYMLEII